MSFRVSVRPIDYVPRNQHTAWVRGLAARGEAAWLDSAGVPKAGATGRGRDVRGSRSGTACGDAEWDESRGADARGSGVGDSRGRYSVIGRAPIAVIEQFDGREAEFRVGERVVDRDANGWRLWERTHRKLLSSTGRDVKPVSAREANAHALRDAPFVSLREANAQSPRDANLISGRVAACRTNRVEAARADDDGIPPYSPGWIGYVGYEMAGQLERLPPHRPVDSEMPLLRVALFDEVIVLDHESCQAFVLAADGLRDVLGAFAAGGESHGRGGDASGDRLEHLTTAGDELPGDMNDARPPCRGAFAPPRLNFESAQHEHEAAVRRALEYIAAGDVYQVNLAHRICMDGPIDALDVHERIRGQNPAEYAALLRWTDRGESRAVISASPELFLDLRGGRVRTRPIKGTRPRLGDEVLDPIRRRELVDSEKEAAELAMIVDLHRNDLGRVCDFGSIRVDAARVTEEHPTVFHTVAEISGRLAAGRDAFDLLRAAFPAGSVTGAPKIRAMQVIRELEPSPRVAYTGAIGWLGLNGDMTWNVAIRTVQQAGARAWLHVGGGIVADSDPAAEYEETLAKGRGIVAAIAHDEKVRSLEVKSKK